MANKTLCPYCNNAPPYFLAHLTVSKIVTMNKIVALTDEVIALKKELMKLKVKL